ncbi:short-chain dehydrogenase [Rhodococcus pyridinivorans KG-16]|uniref:Short-chain dehydrogenase n=1 Tax=Rhodococcus pyridinivorans KG-16 TaxID=1441730 RepID=A0A0V9UDB2_9NOCA|nr:SDR family NAD(P)-dependent oxidoreductase [Rhodococcus pyridinivorans]KSZ56097.1 short-chain dehydrogenase [Rhodococcus pyridinivorans KG-16]
MSESSPYLESLQNSAETPPDVSVQPESASWTEHITPDRFTGRTVIVTGAGSGIGRATASRVAREGGRVVAVDVLAERLAGLVDGLTGVDIVAVTGDITKQADIDAIVKAANGRVDGLANVAGIADDLSPLHETTDEMWDRIMQVNLTGAFKLTRAVLPLMLEAQHGSIVNVGSGASLGGSASGNAYTTSKHAVIGLTRSAAFMYGQQGIRVNALAPGAGATNIQPPSNLSDYGRTRLAPFHQLIPSVATAEELAASITFLLSEDAVNINGAVLSSDGGWSVQ